MGVLGPPGRVLFCEGKEDGLDQLVLSRLLEGAAGWTVVPTFSKSGYGSFAKGYLRSKDPASWSGVLDRDFDLRPPDAPQLLSDPRDRSVWRLHRAEIENYLLDPDLIAAYWREGEAGGKPEFRRAESPAQIRARIEAAARALVSYEATRWALATLRDRQPRRLTTTWRGSGDPPPVAELSLDECTRRAGAMLTEHPPLRLQDLERETGALVERFECEEFWRSSSHLVWFSGKDIAKQIQRQDPDLFNLSGGYLKYAAQNFDWTAHPDLVELSQRLREPAR